MQYRFTQNLGSDDAKVFGLDHKECQEGDVATLSQEQFDAISKKYPALLEDPAKVKAVAKEPAILGVPDGEKEAIAEISTTKSKDKLQHVIDSDKRPAVVKAAKERLATL